MFTPILLTTTLLSLALAQGSSVSSAATASSCAAQPVLDACLASTQALVSSCSTTDYSCLCTKYTAVLTYVPFPSLTSLPSLPSPRRKGIQTKLTNPQAASTNVPRTRANPPSRPKRTPPAPTPPSTPQPARPTRRSALLRARVPAAIVRVRRRVEVRRGARR